MATTTVSPVDTKELKARTATWLDAQDDLGGLTPAEVLGLARRDLGEEVSENILGRAVSLSEKWESHRGTAGKREYRIRQPKPEMTETPPPPLPPQQEGAPRVMLVALDDLHDNPWQPRVTENPEAQGELVESIAETGVLQRPLVRIVSNHHLEIAAGHRRIAAVRELADVGRAEGLAWWMVDGRHSIYVDVQELTDEEMRVVAILENTKRSDLTPMETYRAYQRYLDEVDPNITQLAKRVGIDRSTLSHGLRTLNLPQSVLVLVERGRMAFGVARELLLLSCEANGMHMEQLGQVLERLERQHGEAGVEYTRERVRSAMQMLSQEASYNDSSPFRILNADRYALDVDAFVKEHKNTVHVLPTYGNDTIRVTCAVKEWMDARADIAAKIKDNGAANMRKDWYEKIRQSSQLAALRPEESDPEQKATKEELQALGPLGEEPVNSDKLDWSVFFFSFGNNPHFDKTECNGCTKGARWLANYGTLALACTNKECWTGKQKAAEKLAKEEVQVIEKAEMEHVGHIRELMDTSPHWPQVLAVSCQIMIESGYYFDLTGRERFGNTTYQPAASVILKGLLDEGEDGEDKDDDNFGYMIGAKVSKTPEEARDVVAYIVMRIWQSSRDGEGLVALEKALTDGVAQATVDPNAEYYGLGDDGPKCRCCGCTDEDCTDCAERTGEPCHWAEEDLCSACAAQLLATELSEALGTESIDEPIEALPDGWDNTMVAVQGGVS